MIAALAAAAAIALDGGAAQAQTLTQPQTRTLAAYPAVIDRDGLSAWLRESTDLSPGQVVAVSASAATAVVARAPAADGRIEARLRAVAITPQAASRGGVLAWEMRLEVDCRSGQVRSGATIGYATRRGEPEGVTLAPADSAWRRPKPNTALEASWRAICDAKFQPPLTAGQPRIAQATPVKPAVPGADAPASPTPPRLTRASLPLAPSPSGDHAPAKPSPVATQAKSKQASAGPRHSAPINTGGRVAAQVVSSPVEADTRKRLARLQHRFQSTLPGIETRVVPAQVRGRTVYRGVLAGFATRGDARAFCRSLKQDGHSCLVI